MAKLGLCLFIDIFWRPFCQAQNLEASDESTLISNYRPARSHNSAFIMLARAPASRSLICMSLNLLELSPVCMEPTMRAESLCSRWCVYLLQERTAISYTSVSDSELTTIMLFHLNGSDPHSACLLAPAGLSSVYCCEAMILHWVAEVPNAFFLPNYY